MIIIIISLLILWFYFCKHLYKIDYWDRKKDLKERFKIPIGIHLIVITVTCIPFLNLLAYFAMAVLYNACVKEDLDIEFKDNFFCKIGDLFMKKV